MSSATPRRKSFTRTVSMRQPNTVSITFAVHCCRAITYQKRFPQFGSGLSLRTVLRMTHQHLKHWSPSSRFWKSDRLNRRYSRRLPQRHPQGTCVCIGTMIGSLERAISEARLNSLSLRLFFYLKLVLIVMLLYGLFYFCPETVHGSHCMILALETSAVRWFVITSKRTDFTICLVESNLLCAGTTFG